MRPVYAISPGYDVFIYRTKTYIKYGGRGLFIKNKHAIKQLQINRASLQVFVHVSVVATE